MHGTKLCLSFMKQAQETHSLQVLKSTGNKVFLDLRNGAGTELFKSADWAYMTEIIEILCYASIFLHRWQMLLQGSKDQRWLPWPIVIKLVYCPMKNIDKLDNGIYQFPIRYRKAGTGRTHSGLTCQIKMILF